MLYATGFNAWNQLQFETFGDNEPDDIPSFTCVLRRDEDDCVRPFFSYTRVNLKNGGCRVAGLVPKSHERLRTADGRAYTNFVEASNGVVVVHDGKDTLYQYPSIHDLLSNGQCHSFPNFPNITQLVAYETGFAALSSAGSVWTWGDERYTACLGRELTVSSPAETPSLVTDLDDLPTGPITKLAAGGYVLAALTAGNDLYCWGHAGRSPMFDELPLEDAPNPVVIDDKDIVDVAVGEAHMLVLTADREVYVIGSNRNGQLGLPGVASTRSWMRIDLASVLGTGETVTGVAAGPRTSFLRVRRQPEECQ
ncbi:regulator of chromosome condensation 1/beta-lactamase-inhibitor protein II [Chaetomium tenue]|uniref:Regulator of chromosome condensation 1/beta-lactamase-inhibitor protein II n=1 Tax=Chaetomium tenue TaxID=1854479 RepID=A0ACB7NYS0_9PEZI|nr:regulator of chromosome condensation 1/beta-lactamase-inhibitor protein II [Chaetomium globosum]